MQTRRDFIRKSALISLGISISPLVISRDFDINIDEKIKQRANKIHNRIFKLDSHCDTPLSLIHSDFDITQNHSGTNSYSCVDFPRMKLGDMNAMFWAVFLGQGDRNDKAYEAVILKTNTIFEAIHKAVNDNSHIAGLALDSKQGIDLMKQGKHAIYIGIENGYAIGKDISLIQKYYDKGARYITLCHSSNNDICDSSTDKNGKEHDGVSEFGKQVVAEMNKLGIIVDVSHISDKSFFDVIELSTKPVVASHSCAKALCNHPRNMTDDMIKALAKNGGVIQMCILSDYVKTPEPFPERTAAKDKVREKYNNFRGLTDEEMVNANRDWYAIDEEFPPKLATVKDVVDHIDHIVNLVGIEHIGIGTDFDGGGGVADCIDVSQIGAITEELVRRNYSEKEIKKIWGENFLRVMKSVEL